MCVCACVRICVHACIRMKVVVHEEEMNAHTQHTSVEWYILSCLLSKEHCSRSWSRSVYGSQFLWKLHSWQYGDGSFLIIITIIVWQVLC